MFMYMYHVAISVACSVPVHCSRFSDLFQFHFREPRTKARGYKCPRQRSGIHMGFTSFFRGRAAASPRRDRAPKSAFDDVFGESAAADASIEEHDFDVEAQEVRAATPAAAEEVQRPRKWQRAHKPRGA